MYKSLKCQITFYLTDRRRTSNAIAHVAIVTDASLRSIRIYTFRILVTRITVQIVIALATIALIRRSTSALIMTNEIVAQSVCVAICLARQTLVHVVAVVAVAFKAHFANACVVIRRLVVIHAFSVNAARIQFAWVIFYVF